MKEKDMRHKIPNPTEQHEKARRLLSTWDALTISAVAIIHMHELGFISEGQAVKLMNCPDIVTYRSRKYEVEKELAAGLDRDMTAQGWEPIKLPKWPADNKWDPLTDDPDLK